MGVKLGLSHQGLRTEHGMRMFKSRMIMKIVPGKEEVKVGFRKLHYETSKPFCPQPSITRESI
jgi:hypothetical protein